MPVAPAALLVLAALGVIATPGALAAAAAAIDVSRETIALRSDNLVRTLSTEGGNLRSVSMRVAGEELLEGAATELAFVATFASPNRAPVGITAEQSIEKGEVPRSAKEPLSYPMKILKGMENDYLDTLGVDWINPVSVDSADWGGTFSAPGIEVYRPAAGVTRLVLSSTATHGPLKGLACNLTYEVYDGYPVVRKWVSFANNSDRWIKLCNLTFEGLSLKPAFRNKMILGPGAVDQAETLDLDPNEVVGPGYMTQAWVIYPSVVAFGNADHSRGVIATSEIPSAMREIRDDGAMAYRKELFEWVLGPSEAFTSEPVFIYAYDGATFATPSAVSTPRDRATEGAYQKFLHRHVGLAAAGVKLHTPVWSIWEVSWRNVHDRMLREQAVLAARCGFKQIEVDAGWQWDELDAQIDTEKFPDFADTCRFIDSLGLKLSMWISNYRSKGSRDLAAHPDDRVVPLITKERRLGPGYGMSYASKWRSYFARDLIALHQQYGIIGFKQDHCNIRAGDIGLGHESRTRKESLLRGFRALFAMQEMISQVAPEVINNITHETYWDRPNPGCDIAALKYGTSYHIPPNRHDGGEDVFLYKARGRPAKSKYYGGAPTAEAAALVRRQAYLTGCEFARNQMYAHRGLPLRSLQFSALITINQDNSLTPQVQDRQVCSLLMGSPLVYSGDLTTLTEENIKRYADRFALVERLNDTYGIYEHFQFSGVPVPTDQDWHWWGKLNDEGHGAVVVLRGREGAAQRTINVPWVDPERRYRVTAHFAERGLGTFSGRQLQEGEIRLELPAYGQEILELAPASPL